MIAEKKKEFIVGAEDYLKAYGIYDSDDEIDLTNFKSSRQSKAKK